MDTRTHTHTHTHVHTHTHHTHARTHTRTHTHTHTHTSHTHITHTVNVKIFAGNKFRGRGTYTYRWDIRVKKISRSAPYVRIFIPAYYMILPMSMESFSWQYTAALRGSYIVDIVSRARRLRRHWSVSVDHWQWRVKTRLAGSNSEGP